jgi:hypothetical protein
MRNNRSPPFGCRENNGKGIKWSFKTYILCSICRPNKISQTVLLGFSLSMSECDFGIHFLGNQTEAKRERESYDEEDGIGGLGPNGGIDGVFNFPREHVLFQELLHRHFLLVLSLFRSALSSSRITMNATNSRFLGMIELQRFRANRSCTENLKYF